MTPPRNPKLQFGATTYFVPICIRHAHGYLGGPAGYQAMTVWSMAKEASPIVLPVFGNDIPGSIKG